MERKIYCYYKKHENELRIKCGESPIFKIGDTAEQTVDERINQQDNSSNSEALVCAWSVSVPNTFMPNVTHVDKKFHEWLFKKHGIIKYREDKDREWYEFTDSYEAKRYLNEFIYNKHVLNTYGMRPCQLAACNHMVSYYKNDGNNFLLAAKMRFGKNFTFLNFIKQMNYKNVLVLSYKNVFASLETDINDHILFVDNFKYIEYKKERGNIINCIDKNKINIVVCSAQMAGYSYNIEDITDEISIINGCTKAFKKNVKNLSGIPWDLIITDECHYGTDTANFNEICNSLNCNIMLYISGTPFKTLHSYTDDALYMYTYLDEQKDSDNKMPKMYQYGLRLDSNLISKYHKYIEVTDYPTMKKAFQAENGKFKYPEIAENIIDHVLSKGIKSQNMDEINHMLILMDNVNACTAATNYINNSIIHNKTFFAINAAGQGYNVITDTDNLKKEIIKSNNVSKKSITFSCGRFVEGTTIPEWNAVIMLNDLTSATVYFQAIFRAQSPDKNGNKQKFYVIDYKPDRLLSINYEFIKNLPVKHSKSYNNIAIEWLKATDIVITDPNSDQDLRKVSYSDIEKAFFSKGLSNNGMVNNPYMYNVSRNIKIDNEQAIILANALNMKGSISIATITNPNNITGGKSNKKYKNNTHNPNADKKEKIYKIVDLINAFKRIMGKTTKFIVSHKECQDFETFIQSITNNKCEFEDIIKDPDDIDKKKRHNITTDLFLSIIKDYNFINIEGFNAVCNEFWRHYNIAINGTIDDKRNFRTKWELNDKAAIINDNLIYPLLNIIDYNDINLCNKTIMQINAVDTYMLEIIVNNLFNSISYITKYNDVNKRINAIYSNIYVTCNSIIHYNYIKTFMPNINIIINDNIKDLYNNMKFDYIIQNPPYSIPSDKEIYLQFYKLGMNHLTKNGKMSIISPANWLNNINNADKPIYTEIKNMINHKVTNVYMENFNKEFGIKKFEQLVIMNISNEINTNDINFICAGYNTIVHDIADCNIIGKFSIIKSIINKINISNYEMMASRKIDKNRNTLISKPELYYIRYAYIRSIHGPNSDPDYQKTAFGEYYNYTTMMVHKDDNDIKSINTLPINDKSADSAYTYLYGTYDELTNWKYYVYNNKLPLFLSICMSFNRHNNVKNYIPFIVDKQYTDDEIFDKFNLSDEEIKFIDITIKKYERQSPWFIRTMTGIIDNHGLSDNSIQKFIDNL